MTGMVPMKKYEKAVSLPLDEICILCCAKLVRDHGLNEDLCLFLDYKKLKGFCIPDDIPQVVYVQINLKR